MMDLLQACAVVLLGVGLILNAIALKRTIRTVLAMGEMIRILMLLSMVRRP